MLAQILENNSSVYFPAWKKKPYSLRLEQN